MIKVYFRILIFFSFILFSTPLEAKIIIVESIESFALSYDGWNTYVVESPIDFQGRSVELGPHSTIQFKNAGAVYNGIVTVGEKSKINNGVFIVEDRYTINDVIIIRGQGCTVYNTIINGKKSSSRFGISVFDSPNTRIKSCIIENIGSGEDNTAGIRLQGNCSNSVVVNTSIDNITAKTNASGILIQSSGNGQHFSCGIKIINCRVSRITPVADGDGIKILQNHRTADHVIKNCEFIDCAKRAIKIQGLGVRCLNNHVNGGCYESVIDYQNGDCCIDGLNAINLGYVYAGIYVQGSEGPVYINNVNIKANNTEKQYVRGIKIKRAGWDINNRIKSVKISRCEFSDFYQTFSIEDFDYIDRMKIYDCCFCSVAQPIYIGSSVGKIYVLRCIDRNIGGNRASLYFPDLDTCKESKIDIKEVRK